MSSKAGTPRPAHVDKATFRRACAKFATGVTIVTVVDRIGRPHGMTASSFTSVSLDPPLVLVCVDHRATVLEHLRRAEYVGINVLSEGQHKLSAHFARRGEGRFNGVPWHSGHHGAPLLAGVLASFECRMDRMVDAGDHAILIAEPVHIDHRDGRPLVYFASSYHKLDGATGT